MAHSFPLPPYLQAKVDEIEAELDQLHPGWRQKQRFDKVHITTKMRVKWLLKRMSLLNHTEDGQPCPLDWDVLVVKDAKNPNQCYAHPVIPATVKQEGEPPREPPSPLLAVHRGLSRPVLERLAPQVAADLGVPQEEAVTLLEGISAPDIENPSQYARKAKARKIREAKAEIERIGGLTDLSELREIRNERVILASMAAKKGDLATSKRLKEEVRAAVARAADIESNPTVSPDEVSS